MEREWIQKLSGIICLMAGMGFLLVYFTVQDDPNLELVSIPRMGREERSVYIERHCVIKPFHIGPVTVSPEFSLPEGLDLDLSTGIISGTPKHVQSSIPYHIGDDMIWIEILDPHPVYPDTVYAHDMFRITIPSTPATDFKVHIDEISGSNVTGIDVNTGEITGQAKWNEVIQIEYTLFGATHATFVNMRQSAAPLSHSFKVENAIPNVTYTVSDSYDEGHKIDISPTNTNAVRFTVSPALPEGLSMDSATGRITGGVKMQDTTNYTISAYGVNGELQTVVIALKFTGSLVYGGTVSLIKNVDADLKHETDTRFNSYEIHPFLPAGLTMDTSTGAISGKPKGSSKGTYTVTAWHSSTGATGRGTFDIHVTDGESSDMYTILGLGAGFSAVGVALIGTSYVTDEQWRSLVPKIK